MSGADANKGFELDSFLPYRLNRASEWASRRFGRSYHEKYRMTRPEWRTLAILGEQGRVTATDICKLSSLHKTKVSRAVASLENRKWLKREQKMQDRREEWLDLTAKGIRAYQDLADRGLDHDKELVALLGERDAEALKQGLLAIERIFSEDGQ
jgi:DNA-binding MarR family transcriptional regulator